MSDLLPALRPQCLACGLFMDLRPGYNPKTRGNGHTLIDQWCGVWYDHPLLPSGTLPFGHASSVLFPSEALLAQEAEMTQDVLDFRDAS